MGITAATVNACQRNMKKTVRASGRDKFAEKIAHFVGSSRTFSGHILLINDW